MIILYKEQMFDYIKCIEKLCIFIVQRGKAGNLTGFSEGN